MSPPAPRCDAPDGTPARAEPIDAERARALRRAVLRPHEALEALAAREPADAHHVGVVVAGEVVAVGRVRPEGAPGEWRVNGMATHPDHRGRGHGSAVLEALVARARLAGAERVWCTARCAAAAFYERHGFAVDGEAPDDPITGPHVRMSRPAAMNPGE